MAGLRHGANSSACIFWPLPHVRTAFWRAVCGRFARPIDETDLPRGLLARFPGDAGIALVVMLRFLSPLTTSASTVGEAPV